jgi:hypothetical protein
MHSEIWREKQTKHPENEKGTPLKAWAGAGPFKKKRQLLRRQADAQRKVYYRFTEYLANDWSRGRSPS